MTLARLALSGCECRTNPVVSLVAVLGEMGVDLLEVVASVWRVKHLFVDSLVGAEVDGVGGHSVDEFWVEGVRSEQRILIHPFIRVVLLVVAVDALPTEQSVAALLRNIVRVLADCRVLVRIEILRVVVRRKQLEVLAHWGLLVLHLLLRHVVLGVHDCWLCQVILLDVVRRRGVINLVIHDSSYIPHSLRQEVRHRTRQHLVRLGIATVG